ncbi:collagen-like repeat preface domain-containing protein [Bacillus sp. JJ864]|uniref:collagen-like repeat preface domain-containing protein n=1 Tax=Bacillus sp. JJ864 TaxID=3122975 RepID=UPI002FFE30B4
MSYFNDNEKNVSMPYFPIHSHRIPAVHYTHASTPSIKRLQKTLSDLTHLIPAVFSTPSQSNVKELINILEAIQGDLKRLNVSLTQRGTGIEIARDLITILNNQPFSANVVYIGLQNLLNFSLYIIKSFKMNHHVSENIIEQTKNLQIALLQIMPLGMNDQLQDDQEHQDEHHIQEEFEFLDEHCVQNNLKLLDEHLEQSELKLSNEHLEQNDPELSNEHYAQNDLELLNAHYAQNDLALLDEQQHQDKQLQESEEELISLHLPV